VQNNTRGVGIASLIDFLNFSLSKHKRKGSERTTKQAGMQVMYEETTWISLLGEQGSRQL
jgi:hypothetical protein